MPSDEKSKPAYRTTEDDLVFFGRDDVELSEFVCSMACFRKRYGGVEHAGIFGIEELVLAIGARGPSAGLCVGCSAELLPPERSGRA